MPRIASDPRCLVLLVCLGSLGPIAAQDQVPRPADPSRLAIRRAVAFLSREVSSWRKDHACFSCHNNGDAARALFAARHAGFSVDPLVYQDTADFLSHPDRWEGNGPQGEFNDTSLARLQFAVALSAAVDTGLVPSAGARHAGGQLLSKDQVANGSWEFVGADEPGSPITYGRTLATAMAVRALRVLDNGQFAQPREAADRWLRTTHPQSVMNAAATLLGVGTATDEAARGQRARCLKILQTGEDPAGGWGQYANSAAESFDTALVLVALVESRADGWDEPIRRGRDFLVRLQLSDGSWPETTRPAGRESYAHRVSTTGWATWALIQTLRP
ncbi:MAG: prenyltransferase/squalene oxidase repeat-containing protein [Pirellulaceae bacterium]